MTELEIQIASIDNQIEALKTKRIELLNKLFNIVKELVNIYCEDTF